MASDAFYQAYVEIVPEGSKLLKGINKEFDSAAPAAGKNAGEKLSSGILDSFAGVAAGIAALIATALGAVAAGSVLKGGLDRLLNIDDASAKLRGLGNDAATVDEIMVNALASVKGTAFGLDEAATIAASAIAAGIKPGRDLERYLKLTADTATIAGGSLEDLGRVFNNVTTIGAAYNDSLQVLAGKGIPIYQYLAEELGVTTDEVKDFASEGKISSETFQSVIEKNIAGAALSAGDTTRGAFANMLASLNRVAANLLSGVFPLFKQVFQGITTLLGPVEDGARRVGIAIGNAFERAIPAAQGLYDLIGRGDFSAGLREATGLTEDSKLVDFLLTVREKAISMGSALKNAFAPVFSTIGAAIGPLIPKVLDLWTQFSPFSLVLQALVPLLPKVAPLIEALGTSIGTLLGAVVGALPLLEPALSSLTSALGSVLSSVLENVATLLPQVAGALATLVTGIAPLIPKILELVPALLELLPPLTDLVAKILPPLVDLLLTVLPPIIDYVSFMLTEVLVPALQWAIENWAGLFDAISNLLDFLSGETTTTEFIGRTREIGGAFGWVLSVVLPWAQQMGAAIGAVVAFFRPLIEVAIAVFTGIYNTMMSLFSWWLAYVFPLIQAFGGLVGAVFDFVYKTIVSTLVAGFSVVQNIWSGIYSFVATVVSNVVAFIQNGWGALVGIVRGIFGDVVASSIGQPLGGVLGLFETVKNNIINVFRNAGSWLADAGRNIIGGLVNGIQGALGGLTDLLSGITNMIPEVKGPPARDKVLLEGNGQLIMGGLLRGIQQGTPPVMDYLTDLTGDVGTGNFVTSNVVRGNFGSSDSQIPTMRLISDMNGLEQFVRAQVMTANGWEDVTLKSGSRTEY